MKVPETAQVRQPHTHAGPAGSILGASVEPARFASGRDPFDGPLPGSGPAVEPPAAPPNEQPSSCCRCDASPRLTPAIAAFIAAMLWALERARLDAGAPASPEVSPDVGADASVPTWLDGAREAAAFHAMLAEVEVLDERELADAVRAEGVDVLVWRAVEHLAPIEAARRFLSVLCAMTSSIAELDTKVLLPAQRALANFPDTWTSTHATGVLAMEAYSESADPDVLPAFRTGRPGDMPGGMSPTETVLGNVVFLAYPTPTLDLRAQRCVFARAIFDVVTSLAELVDGDRAALLAFHDAVRSAS